MKRYPHQLSGGMLQRCVIAMALMTNPSLLIMDEPTTALDVTTQAVVLDLVAELKREFDSAILYITHDLGVITKICDRVGVMYAGEFMEQADLRELFKRPLHPYTLDLLGCVPHFDPTPQKRSLVTIPGSIPRRRRAAGRLHLRAALQLRRGGLHDGPPAARGGRGRPPLGLPPLGGGAAAGRVPARGDRGRRVAGADQRAAAEALVAAVEARRSTSRPPAASSGGRTARAHPRRGRHGPRGPRRPDPGRGRRERQRQDHRRARHHRPHAGHRRRHHAARQAAAARPPARGRARRSKRSRWSSRTRTRRSTRRAAWAPPSCGPLALLGGLARRGAPRSGPRSCCRRSACRSATSIACRTSSAAARSSAWPSPAPSPPSPS